MRKIVLLIFSFLAFHWLTFSQVEATTTTGKKVLLQEDGTWIYADSVQLNTNNSSTILNLEIPRTNSKDIVITHSGFSLVYNETHEQASWVAYELTKKETNKLYDRINKFIPDPKVSTKTANDKDYEYSGYDRGHLAPAADMGWSEISMAESFYYSNMSPQNPSFNRGVWKRLEEQTRTWAIENNSIYIVTGPVLTNDLLSIGPNKISIPNYYYKVILDYNKPNIKAIGFIIPNTSSSEPLYKFAVTIDSVETFTGIDFFPSLPDIQEKSLEKTLCINCWTWESLKTISQEKENKTSTPVQCKQLTKAGRQCKNKTLNTSGYCYLHDSL